MNSKEEKTELEVPTAVLGQHCCRRASVLKVICWPWPCWFLREES